MLIKVSLINFRYPNMICFLLFVIMEQLEAATIQPTPLTITIGLNLTINTFPKFPLSGFKLVKPMFCSTGKQHFYHPV